MKDEIKSPLSIQAPPLIILQDLPVLLSEKEQSRKWHAGAKT